jgi:mercuric ion transport protein
MTTGQFAARLDATTAPKRDAAGPLAALSAATGLGALAASSCCVLPLALAGIGAGGAVFGGLEVLIAYKPYILGAAAMSLAGAWLVFWKRRRLATCAANGACARAGTPRRTLVALAFATLSVKAALLWGFIEPILLKAVQ